MNVNKTEAETEAENGVFQKTGEAADKLTKGIIRLIGSVAPKVQHVTGNGLKKVAEGASSAAENLEKTPANLRKKAERLEEKAEELRDEARRLEELDADLEGGNDA